MIMGTVTIVAAVVLAAGAALAVVRVERGPSMLDRTVGFDLLTTILVGAIALEAAWSRRTESIPILVVLSLVGFVSSVTIARFAAVEPTAGADAPGADGVPPVDDGVESGPPEGPAGSRAGGGS